MSIDYPTATGKVYVQGMPGVPPPPTGKIYCAGESDLQQGQTLVVVRGQCKPYDGGDPPSFDDTPPVNAPYAARSGVNYRFLNEYDDDPDDPQEWLIDGAVWGDSAPYPQNRVCVWIGYYPAGTTDLTYKRQYQSFGGVRCSGGDCDVT